MATYYVSPAGVGSGPGTIGAPWSLTYAASGAAGTIVAGDIILLRDGAYSSVTGYTISVNGTAGSRITFDAYPNETPIIDGAIAAYTTVGNTAWTLHDAGTNTYKTVSTSMGATTYFGHIQIAGVWYPLATHKLLTGLMAATQNYSADGVYYMGPGILEDGNGGQVYIRLSDATSAALQGRVVTPVANIDPRQNDIRLFTENNGLTLSGNYVTVRGVTINDYYTAVNITGTGVRVETCTARFGYHGCRLGFSASAVLSGCVFNGLMYHNTYWVGWYDVKGGTLNADATRKVGLHADTATAWRVTNCQFLNVFDGVLSEGTNGGEFDNNTVKAWDDAWQLYASVYNTNIHHNRFLGAGISRDSSGSNLINPNPGTVYVHHNITDPSVYRILWGRTGVPDTGEGRLGFWDPIAASTHGSPGAGRWPSPWKFYHNTLIHGTSVVVSNLDYFGEESAEFIYAGVTNDLFNNIFVLGAYVGRDFHSNTGRERMDGNHYSGPPTAAQSRWRFLHTSTGIIDGEPGADGINTIAEMKASRAYADSQAYYSPGWEHNGTEGDPLLDYNYVPANATCLSGAVNLTGTGWPGTTNYEAFRGAGIPVFVSRPRRGRRRTT